MRYITDGKDMPKYPAWPHDASVDIGAWQIG